jgi:hypothetical protein
VSRASPIEMPEAIRSVMLAGRGLLRWGGGEERVQYRVNVGLDGVIRGVHISSPRPDILSRPSRHLGIFLHMPEGRRLGLNVAPNRHLSPDGPIERSLDAQDWWTDTTPWLPFETADRFTLTMQTGSVQVFESHTTPEEAAAAFHNWKEPVEGAEIRPPFGRPMPLERGLRKGSSA